MYLCDISDLENEYGWDAEVISCSVVIKDRSGVIHAYAMNEYKGLVKTY